MTVCSNCGAEFKISGFKRLVSNQTICPHCKSEKDKKVQRYIDAINFFGRDNYLTKEEETSLQELKLNLGLNDNDVKKANEKLEKLCLSTAKVDAAAHKQKIDECDRRIASISSDGIITLEEENELSELMRSLGLTESDLPDMSRRTLFDARMLTTISRGVFPELQVSLLLKPNEICHFMSPAQLMEELTKTRYVGGSHGASFRVAKGVTFRTGSFRGQPIKENYAKITDDGTLYVTNKKVLFVGMKKNVSYPINKIVDITKYTDGIKFQKENENKPRVFLINQRLHIDAIGLIVSMLAQKS